MTRLDGTRPEVIAAAGRGDRDALEAVLHAHYDDVLRLCVRLCADRHDGQDAAQNAMIAIARGIAGYDGRARFSTWVYRVAANACTDELRRRGRRPVPAEDAERVAESSPRATSTSVAEDPADATVRSEQRHDLDLALARLPEDFRRPVVLRDVAGLDYAEIAEVLGIAPGTVRSRISRGRRRLADLLAGNPETSADVETMDPR